MSRHSDVKSVVKIVIGFGWKDLHHPWSKNGKVYTADELFKYLVDILQGNIPSRQSLSEILKPRADNGNDGGDKPANPYPPTQPGQPSS